MRRCVCVCVYVVSYSLKPMTCSQLQKPAPDDWRRFVARISADTLCYYRAYIFF